MSDDFRTQAEKLAGDLHNAGHTDHAATLRQTLSAHPVEDGLLKALRGVCDVLLTVVEAIDPVSEVTLEQLKRNLDARLTAHDPTPTGPV